MLIGIYNPLFIENRHLFSHRFTISSCFDGRFDIPESPDVHPSFENHRSGSVMTSQSRSWKKVVGGDVGDFVRVEAGEVTGKAYGEFSVMYEGRIHL